MVKRVVCLLRGENGSDSEGKSLQGRCGKSMLVQSLISSYCRLAGEA